jgi:formylglycine-generating enzyme required for sulfatase activity
MSTDPSGRGSTARPSGIAVAWSGLLFVAAFVLAIAAWRSVQFPGGVAAAAAGAPAQPVAAPEPDGLRADAWYLPDDPLLGFVRIPAGPFLMGSDPARDPLAFDNEVTPGGSGQRTVHLSEYLIGRFEVTVAQYRAFIEDTGHPVIDEALWPPGDHPVASITWPDALAYARWLERTLRAWPGTPPGIAELLDEGWRITLPTEAEWEKAARGVDGRIYPWGDEPRPDGANFAGRATTPVGSFRCDECAFGLADMSGNVWEWTRSPYLDRPYDSAIDLLDLEADALWVMRGGSFLDGERNVRAAIRGGADPGVRRPFIGFRLVISPS